MAAIDPPAPDDQPREPTSDRWDEAMRDDPRNRLALPRDAYYLSLVQDPPPADPES